MAYQEWSRGNGVYEVRVFGAKTVSGKTVNIVCRDDGKWIVREDPEPNEFEDHGAALDHARRIGGDPDL
jgi:hypothetical protein